MGRTIRLADLEAVPVAWSIATLKAPKSWQVAGITLALVAAAGGGWAAWRAWGPGSQPAIATDQQVVPVQRGDLISSVSVNGTLSFPTRETLTFGSAGTVARVAVAAGQVVRSGEELARLDTATIANLEATVAQARVNAKNAAEALALAQTPDPVRLAQARVDAQNAQNALDTLLNPSGLVLAQAESAAANARVSLQNAGDAFALAQTPDPVRLAQARVDAQNAQNALDTLLNPSGLVRAQAESAVANARVSLQNAEETRQDFLDSNSAAELKSALESAETSLRNATDSLAVTQATWESRLPLLRTA
jgi:multidrug efflux pump subunit AcrA (membrane-fusion protein)